MRHLTQRVAWHEHAWDGTVCANPRENAFCLALDRIHEERDDEYEAGVAGRHWSELDGDPLPPCTAEAAAFMSDQEWTRVIRHPYQEIPKAEATHGHLRPTPVPVPRYSTFAVPFDRMLVRRQEALADELAIRLPDDQEAPFTTNWVFGRRRQEALLDSFFGAFTEDESLVFFYTKEGHPLGDTIRRLVVGVGRITKVDRPLEYDSVGSKAVPPVWAG